jgi:hypothetical protein
VHGGPQRRTFVFDDLGCAITWLERQPWRRAERVWIWVSEPLPGKEVRWLDARAVRYRQDRSTPMGYGFSPAAAGAAGAIGFEDMRRRVLSERRR